MIDFIKVLYSKFRLFLYKVHYKLAKLHKREKQPKLFPAMIVYRAKELSKKQRDWILTGDSIIHFGENLFEQGNDIFVTAIAGDTTDSLLSRLQANVLIGKPEKVLIHCAGNDFLAGKSVDYVYNNLVKIFSTLKFSGVKKVGWMEVIPLGDPGNSILSDNHRIIQFHKRPVLLERIKRSAHIDVIEYANSLSITPGSWIKVEYESGDKIHVNKKAYKDVIMPVVLNWFRK